MFRDQMDSMSTLKNPRVPCLFAPDSSDTHAGRDNRRVVDGDPETLRFLILGIEEQVLSVQLPHWGRSSCVHTQGGGVAFSPWGPVSELEMR